MKTKTNNEQGLLNLLANIRAAAGDPSNKLMQDELIMRIKSLADDSSRLDKLERECEFTHGRAHLDGTYGTRKSWEVFTDFDQGPLTLREAIDQWGGDE
jgi:hypothetical protein